MSTITSPSPDPSTFPDPERYATYIPHRSGNKFKTHASLRLTKLAISAKATSGRVRTLNCNAWVYEYDFDLAKWVEVAHLPKDTDLDNDPWYKQKTQGVKALAPSQGAIDQAIASLTK